MARTYFNTSHVSINPIREKTHYFRRRISIHLMFLLIKGGRRYQPAPFLISIHLMFLLISVCVGNGKPIRCISIHLMFLLIKWHLPERIVVCRISIHLMFLLILSGTKTENKEEDFNTSHVSINHKKMYTSQFSFIFQYISCFY